MPFITIGDKTYEYTLYRQNRKTLTMSVKAGKILVKAPYFVSDLKIEEFMRKHQTYIDNQLEKTTPKNEIHVGGILYIPKYYTGNNEQVVLEYPYIKIYAKKNDINAYKKVLYQFYKSEVERELESLMPTLKEDFKEINLPKIQVHYMKSMYGNYYKNKYLIHISSMMAKYDYAYIKSVLYHEMSHIFYFNHSKDFYALYDRKYPNAKKIQQSLKKIKYCDVF